MDLLSDKNIAYVVPNSSNNVEKENSSNDFETTFHFIEMIIETKHVVSIVVFSIVGLMTIVWGVTFAPGLAFMGLLPLYSVWNLIYILKITLDNYGIVVKKLFFINDSTRWKEFSKVTYVNEVYDTGFRLYKNDCYWKWAGISTVFTNHKEGLEYIVTKIPQTKFSESAQKKLAELGIFFPVQFTPASNPNNVPSFTIPEGTKAIAGGTFEDCSRLSSVKIPNSVTEIGIDAFRNCTGLWSIAIPAGVTFIGEGAFSGCTDLRSITIPRGVKVINLNTFRDCTALKSIIIHKPSPPKVTADAFNGIDKNKISLYVPVNSIDAYTRAKGWKDFKGIAPTPREVIWQ